MQALDGSASFLTPLGASYYASSNHLTVDHYQALVDRGWRRSGTVLYKPDVRRSCCPHYTIRLPAASFKPTRDQRQAVNRWNRYVLGDEYIDESKKRHPKSKEEKAKTRNEFDLYEAIHEAEYAKLKTPPEPAHRFKITLEPDNLTEEKFQLFSNYQQAVHHDKPSDISKKSFQRFLCKSPLQRRRLQGSSSVELGSFHQCYWLDGRLIAMAVLDLLPHAVSGVYFLYHSDFEKFSFGKLSALREAALAEELGLKYYYMGYYIHNCKKMRYKGDYRPQYVLDPETNEWDPLADVASLLDQKNYVSLSREKRSAAAETGHVSGDEVMDIEAHGKHLDSAAAAFEATQNGLSLFELGLPGMMTPQQLQEKVDLDEIMIPYMGNMVLRAAIFKSLEEGAITDSRSLLGILAELAACVGPEVAREMLAKVLPGT
ncbi:arginine-tRNA-protein transferase 1 [Saccharata proteae CBS 121410]|uniref:Arginyl-tRNA--protein transferase 1 n=1 Tax=Saccharata proteae CBS 121410 TaxID=1314787 RepID=A0A9P4LYA8_9PEZI|nr:arginine-tRNA-protein transferase 1 [Saccharata proteae CBS 121410]